MRFIYCWSLYYLGDLASKLLALFDHEGWCDFWYPIYNRLMMWSNRAQGDKVGKRWPWEAGEKS